MTPSLSLHDGQGVTHRVRYSTGSGVLELPTRLAPLAPTLSDVLLLDEIKTLLGSYNHRTGRALILTEVPRAGWCADCQSFFNVGESCGCRK